MKKIIHRIFILFSVCFFLLPKHNLSQEVIVVHKNLGVLIDSVENYRYLLFTDYSLDDFTAAQVFKSFVDGSYYQVIYLKNNRVINQPISQDSIKLLSDRVEMIKNDYSQQDTANLYSVTTADGSVLIGKIKFFSNFRIELYSNSYGKVEVITEEVNLISKYEGYEKNKGLSKENSHYSRYFYAPSAIPIEKGEGYFQDIYLLFLSANYSITNHATIGAGFSIIPGIDFVEQAFFVNAKVAYEITDKFYLGGGGLYFGLGEMGGNIGIGYVVGTYGTKNHNATLGVGYGLSGNQLMETPVFTLCGMTRLSKRISFMSENWFGTVSYEKCIPPDCMEYETVREFHCLVSYGLRFFSENISVDIAFLNVPTSEEIYFPGIPYIDFVVRF